MYVCTYSNPIFSEFLFRLVGVSRDYCLSSEAVIQIIMVLGAQLELFYIRVHSYISSKFATLLKDFYGKMIFILHSNLPTPSREAKWFVVSKAQQYVVN